METEEENNEWILNFFGCKIDIRVLFGAVIISTFIYWAIMCFIFCCGHEPGSTTLWSSSANFGNMFGYLSCVFSGLASVAMVATFIKQGEQLKSQEETTKLTRESIHQTERLNEEKKIISMIDGLDKAISNMSVMNKKGNEASTELFDLAIQAIKSIQAYGVGKSIDDIDKFTKAIHCSFYHIMFKALCILKFINENDIIFDKSKTSLTLYFISSISTSTKKLLNIMFLLNDSLKQIQAFEPLFSRDQTYTMIKKHAKVEDYIIDIFFEKIQEAWSVQR